MDFHLVTTTLLKELEEGGIRYAIIGGFALGLWEVTRATIDMDFLLLVEDLQQAESILAKFAYRRTFKSENVAQYVSDLAPYGQIDIVLAFRKASRSMLERRVHKPLGEELNVSTLLPEDLIGLKLQACVNDPSREEQESSDISSLLKVRMRKGEAIDWDLLGEYFQLFNRADQLRKLKDVYG